MKTDWLQHLRLPYLAITLICFLLTLLVKSARPHFSTSFNALILGWLPSLLYAFGMVFLVLTVRRFPWTYGIWVTLGAITYEFLQAGIPKRTFDPADLIATLTGASLALLLHHNRQHLRPKPSNAPPSSNDASPPDDFPSNTASSEPPPDVPSPKAP